METTKGNKTMFMVTVVYEGRKFWLGGTNWRFDIVRGDKFTTIEEAKASLEKAKKFMHSKIYKESDIERVS